MKNLLLCGIAVLAFSLTPAVKADTVIFNDDITSPTYTDGASINGVNGWTVTAGTMNFDSALNGTFETPGALDADAVASHALAAPGAGDTILDALFFGRLRPDTGLKTLVSLNDGTSDVLSFGVNETGNYVSGAGLLYTTGTDPFNSLSHTFHQLRLTYDEAGGGAGTLFAAPDTSSGLGTSFGPEVTVATFTGLIDVSTLQSVSFTSSSSFDQLGTLNVTSVPEPSSVAWGLICLAGLATRRRRR